jgi:rifampin ADP-ribosylating transferase
MLFDPENPIIKLCAQGMQMEGEGKAAEASALFYLAWDKASNDFERFTAAHYIARHQQNIADKLHWDQTALNLALTIDDENLRATYPSLYLNIAKCHEDMKDYVQAAENYRSALKYAAFLPDDGYGNMIRAGISNGLARLTQV